jgi:hypothetical protein
MKFMSVDLSHVGCGTIKGCGGLCPFVDRLVVMVLLDLLFISIDEVVPLIFGEDCHVTVAEHMVLQLSLERSITTMVFTNSHLPFGSVDTIITVADDTTIIENQSMVHTYLLKE